MHLYLLHNLTIFFQYFQYFLTSHFLFLLVSWFFFYYFTLSLYITSLLLQILQHLPAWNVFCLCFWKIFFSWAWNSRLAVIFFQHFEDHSIIIWLLQFLWRSQCSVIFLFTMNVINLCFLTVLKLFFFILDLSGFILIALNTILSVFVKLGIQNFLNL